ncbi:MAG: hypothetical protein WA962_15090 [Ornithinimicrobium sp.]
MSATRSRDPYPLTWEIPLGILILIATVAGLGVHLARAIANLLTGHGWTWPPGSDELVLGLPAVIGGDATAGLVPDASGASPGVLWATLIVVQTVLLVGMTIGGVYGYTRWGPGRTRGMATRAEAEQLLGLSRLRKNKAIIRPDLYGKGTVR